MYIALCCAYINVREYYATAARVRGDMGMGLGDSMKWGIRTGHGTGFASHCYGGGYLFV
jgi:hypothetical protein